jgi:hypothetical protein
LQIARAFGGDACGIAFGQLDLEGDGDCLGDFVLQFEEVGQLAVVALGPEMPARRGVDELRRHAKLVPGSPHTAL